MKKNSIHLIFVLFLSFVFYDPTVRAQSSISDATTETIEAIGQDMVTLLDELMFGERDPTTRLELLPLIEKINLALSKTPVFLEAQANINLLENQKKELQASFSPVVSTNGDIGQRSFESTSSGGGKTRTTGQFVKQGIEANKILYDFKATDKQILSKDFEILSIEERTKDIESDIFFEIMSSFYEVQRSLLQSRLARENLQSRKAFVNFIRERNELGASSSADVVRAESRVAGALEKLSNTLMSLSRAQASYRQYFQEEAEPYILPKELSVEILDEFDLENYLFDHPEIISAKLSVQSAEANLEAVASRNKGKFNLNGEVSYSRNPGDNNFNQDISTGITFSRDLYSGGSEVLKIEQAQLKLKSSMLELDKVRIRISKDIRESFADYEGGVSAVDAQILVLQGAKETYSITKELYAFSRVSLFEVLSSQEELFNAGIKLIDSVIDRALAKYKLLNATQQLMKQIENEYS